MHRRIAIRNLVAVTAGSIFIPSCVQTDKSALPLKHIQVNAQQLSMMKALCNFLIPGTSSIPGAEALQAHLFVLKMVDDCYAPDDQKKFMLGMTAFDKLCHDKYGQIFTGFTKEQKEGLLSSMETGKERDTPEQYWYRIVKNHTIQAVTTSKQYMTDVQKYKLVPGSKFKGCVPVKNKS